MATTTTTTRSLRLKFEDDEGESVSISYSGVKENLDNATIKAVFTALGDNAEAFKKAPVDFIKAEIVETETKSIPASDFEV